MLSLMKAKQQEKLVIRNEKSTCSFFFSKTCSLSEISQRLFLCCKYWWFFATLSTKFNMMVQLFMNTIVVLVCRHSSMQCYTEILI